MPIDNIGFRGEVDIVVFDKNGNVKDEVHIKNTVVDTGKAEAVALLGGLSSNSFQYVAIGSGTTAVSTSDTTLESEIARKQAAVSRETTNVTNDTLVLVATFSSSDGLTGSSGITESGVFNASSGGVMFNRTVFDVVNVNWDNGDSIQVTWKIRAG